MLKQNKGLGRLRPFCWPQILLKNKFWNKVRKLFLKQLVLKTRTSTALILQVLPWQHFYPTSVTMAMRRKNIERAHFTLFCLFLTISERIFSSPESKAHR